MAWWPGFGAEHGNAAGLWKLVALELGLAVLSDLLGRANSLADSLLGDRFTNRISVRLIEHATQLDLASFEDPVFYDKLERARRQTTGRIGLLAAVLNVAQDTLSLISLSAGLIVFSPWLMVLLIAAVIPAFLGETHFTTLAYSVLYRWTPQRRLLDYIRLLGASNQSAKEIKIFGLGTHLAERYREVSERIYEDNKKVAVKRASVGFPAEPGFDGRLLRRLCGGLDPHPGRRHIRGHVHLPYRRFLPLPHVHRKNPAKFHRYFRPGSLLEGSVRILRDGAVHPKHSHNALPAPRPIRCGFEFRNVGFAYPGSSTMVVENINFRLEAQEKIALIGENGAGKTTLVKLLARLYDPTAGPDPPRRRRPPRIRRRRPPQRDRRHLPGLHAL